jgi:hypothetical protein
MTGSDLAPIVIPIFVMFGLAVWIVLTFYAASHPLWRDQTTAAPSSQPRRVRRAAARSAHRPRPGLTRHPVPAGAAKR